LNPLNWPHKKYVMNLNTLYELCVASVIGVTGKLFKKFETQTFSLWICKKLKKGAYLPNHLCWFSYRYGITHLLYTGIMCIKLY